MTNYLMFQEQGDFLETASEKGKSAPAYARLTSVLFWIAVVGIIGVTIYFRAPLLGFNGFYEPDGYFHYSILRAAVNNGFTIPQIDPLSGWPPVCNNYTCGPAVPHHEPLGLYWVTLLPYLFLQFAGVSYYTVMRLVPMLFGIFEVIGVYFLARYWSRDKFFGLLAMLFVALNMGNSARTSALIYRGDSFVPAFLILALILTVQIFRETEKKRKLAYALGAAVSLSLCNLVWNGAAFATAIYVFSLVMMLVLGFTFEKKKILHDSGYMIIALFVWFPIVALFKSLQWIVSVEAFTGLNFFLLFVPLAAGWYLVDHVENKRVEQMSYTNTPLKRLLVSLGVIFAVLLAIYLIIPSFVDEIFVTSGFLVTNAFSSTIQELQAPNYNFLFASFNFQNFTNPMSIVILIATYFSGLNLLFWFVLLILCVPYLFMHVEGEGEGFLEGSPRLKLGFNEQVLILISYFAITAYLQMNAIRFNSLLSIPMSIFSAFTIYWLILLLKRFRSKPVFKIVFYASFVLLALLMVFVVQTDLGYISGLAPADQINQQFLHALSWLKNNSATNSVVLTLWPDGSLVEGVANRTSVTDSVGSQYAYKANPYAAWLYNASPDPAFLLSKINGKPDYLLVRTTWMQETGGIFTESGINVTPSRFGFNPFTSLNERVNGTTQAYQFFGSGLEEDTVISNSSKGQTIASYLKFGAGIQPFGYVAFYNVVTGEWSIIKQTAFNVTNNQTFLIAFSSVPAPNLFVNITGAYMLNTDLANSNMIKLLFHCSNTLCLWNNKAAALQLVYVNTDTKIFRVFYNQSNPAVAAVNYPR